MTINPHNNRHLRFWPQFNGGLSGRRTGPKYVAEERKRGDGLRPIGLESDLEGGEGGAAPFYGRMNRSSHLHLQLLLQICVFNVKTGIKYFISHAALLQLHDQGLDEKSF